MKRLDPDGKGGYTLHDEANLGQLMSRHLGVKVPYTLGGHNMMYPVPHPTTGEPVHIIGFYGSMAGKPELAWKGSRFYGGALYAVRTAAGKYSVHEVNGPYTADKTLLVSPRAFCRSPFNPKEIFIGGHDSSNKISDNLAWIFRAPLSVAVGIEAGSPAPTLPDSAPRMPRVDDGPVYELRIYAAAEDRLGHLIKRFREHTDRLFRKHKMEPVAYWLPTDGTAKEKRRFVYILKHPSRYAAYQNWNAFTHDPEWKRGVLEKPEFQRLLSERPESIFLTPQDILGTFPHSTNPSIFELRTTTVANGKLPDLQARHRQHTSRLQLKHGMRPRGSWFAYDKPESENTMVTLLRHTNRTQADLNWKAIEADPEWKKSRGNLNTKTDRLYLKPMDFSPMR